MRIIAVITIFISLFACKNNRVPGNIIPPDKMRGITEDMMKADQFFANYIFTRDTTVNKEKKRFALYQQVLDLHHVTKEKFRSSYLYYKDNPALLGEIMDSIQKDLSPKEIPEQELQKKKMQLKDSALAI